MLRSLFNSATPKTYNCTPIGIILDILPLSWQKIESDNNVENVSNQFNDL